MLKRIVYFHGFQGSPESVTKKALDEALPNALVVGVNIDHAADPFLIMVSLEKQLKVILGSHKADLFVGNSAGAFWASYFYKAGCAKKLILINPSMEPQKNLAKYGLAVHSLRGYDLIVLGSLKGYNVTAFIGEKDDIVDNTDAEELYDDVIWLENQGHRLDNFEALINTVKWTV